MKIDDIKTKHESDRITVVLGIIATYIALLPMKDALPFDMTLVTVSSGYVLLYLVGYLVMTAFCYKHDNTYSESLIRNMDFLRRRYYDIGVGVLPLAFFNVIIWSFFDDAIVRTIVLLATSSVFIFSTCREFYIRNKKRTKK